MTGTAGAKGLGKKKKGKGKGKKHKKKKGAGAAATTDGATPRNYPRPESAAIGIQALTSSQLQKRARQGSQARSAALCNPEYITLTLSASRR